MNVSRDTYCMAKHEVPVASAANGLDVAYGRPPAITAFYLWNCSLALDACFGAFMVDYLRQPNLA